MNTIPIKDAHVTMVWTEAGSEKTMVAPKVNAEVYYDYDYESIYSDYGTPCKRYSTSATVGINMELVPNDRGIYSTVRSRKLPRVETITLDSLTPASIALGATELGLGADTAFDVEKDQDTYIVTFREEL